MSRLTRVRVQGKHYYIKFYEQRGRGLRRSLGRSRVRAEWENIQILDTLNIPSARIVAYGEQAGFFGERKGAMITEEIVGVSDLATLAMQESALLKQNVWVKQAATRLADCVSRMHGHGFVHNDLKWRNILMALNGAPAVYVIDCPLGRVLSGWIFKPFLARGIIKDLACLDKIAAHTLSRTRRLGFYLQYAGLEKLTSVHKARIRRILGFFAGRE